VDSIRIHYRIARVADRPGTARIRVVVSTPDSVDRFEFTPPEDATVVSTDGFERGGDEEAYRWTRQVDRPSLTYEVPVNETLGGYTTFVDTPDWTLLDLERIDGSFHYWWEVGTDPGWNESFRTARNQSGHVGARLAYPGNHTVHEERAGPATVRVVVPEATDDDAVGAVVEAIGAASDRLGGETRGWRSETGPTHRSPTRTTTTSGTATNATGEPIPPTRTPTARRPTIPRPTRRRVPTGAIRPSSPFRGSPGVRPESARPSWGCSS